MLADPEPGSLTPAARHAQDAGACVVDSLKIHFARTAIDIHAPPGADAGSDMPCDALDEFLS